MTEKIEHANVSWDDTDTIGVVLDVETKLNQVIDAVNAINTRLDVIEDKLARVSNTVRRECGRMV